MQLTHRACTSFWDGIHLIFLRRQCPAFTVSAHARVTLVLTRTYRMQQMSDDILVCSFSSLLKADLGRASLDLAGWAAVDLFVMQTLNASTSSQTDKSPIDLCPYLGCALNPSLRTLEAEQNKACTRNVGYPYLCRSVTVAEDTEMTSCLSWVLTTQQDI